MLLQKHNFEWIQKAYFKIGLDWIRMFLKTCTGHFFFFLPPNGFTLNTKSIVTVDELADLNIMT